MTGLAHPIPQRGQSKRHHLAGAHQRFDGESYAAPSNFRRERMHVPAAVARIRYPEHIVLEIERLEVVHLHGRVARVLRHILPPGVCSPFDHPGSTLGVPIRKRSLQSLQGKRFPQFHDMNATVLAARLLA